MVVLALPLIADQGLIDRLKDSNLWYGVLIGLYFSNARVDMFGPNQRNALSRILATVAGVAANWAHILSVHEGSLTVECSVDFREDGIAAAKFVDTMVCGQDAAKDLSSLGLGDCRVLIAVAARTRPEMRHMLDYSRGAAHDAIFGNDVTGSTLAAAKARLVKIEAAAGASAALPPPPMPEGECAYFVQSGASIEPYPRGVKLDSRHAQNLGVFLQDVRRDHDGAEKMYRKAIELNPSVAPAYNSLGLLLRDVRKDVDGAERMFRKAIELAGYVKLQTLRGHSSMVRRAASALLYFCDNLSSS